MQGVSQEEADRMVDAVTSDGFRGWHADDYPWVKRQHNGRERSVDKMLKILDRRLRKSGRIEEYKESQRFTKPSKERREARKETEYRIEQQPDHFQP